MASPGAYLFIATGSGGIQVWDTNTDTFVQAVDPGYQYGVGCLYISPNGGTVVGRHNYGVTIIDAATLAVVDWAVPLGPVTATGGGGGDWSTQENICTSPAGDIYYAASYRQGLGQSPFLESYSSSTGTLVRSITAGSGGQGGGCISPDGSLWFVGGAAYNSSTFALAYTWATLGGAAFSNVMGFSLDGTIAYYVTSTSPANVGSFTVATGAALGSATIFGPKALQISPDGTTLYVVTPGSLLSYALPSFTPTTLINNTLSFAVGLAMSPDGTRLYIGSSFPTTGVVGYIISGGTQFPITLSGGATTPNALVSRPFPYHPAPGPPTGLATPVQTGQCEGPQASLSWTAVAGALGYNVYLNGVFYAFTSDAFFLLPFLSLNATIQVSITTVSDFGESAQSAPITFTPCAVHGWTMCPPYL